MTEWIKCSDCLPESQKRVLAFYINECGKNRIELTCYIPPKTVLAENYLSEEAEEADEYDEEKDCYWVKEGWYEDSWESETNWQISQTITHWQPLPDCPM